MIYFNVFAVLICLAGGQVSSGCVTALGSVLELQGDLSRGGSDLSCAECCCSNEG